MPYPKLYCSSFILPKSDASLEECQDAICTATGCESPATEEHDLGQEGGKLRFAVADGLTTAFYSGIWAKQLVDLFHQGKLEDWETDGPAWKEAADLKWREHLNCKRADLGSISQNRLNQCDPAASTFCGIEIFKLDNELQELQWRLIAAGDSCVFHIFNYSSSGLEPEAGYFSHPCTKSAEFSCITAAISNYDTNILPAEFAEANVEKPFLKDGDVLLLATDALSEWILKLSELGKPVWKTIADLDASKPQAFKDLIEAARRESDPQRRLKDDDVALIVIRVGENCHAFISDEFVYVPGDLLTHRSDGPTNSDFSDFISGAMLASNVKDEEFHESATSLKSELIKWKPIQKIIKWYKPSVKPTNSAIPPITSGDFQDPQPISETLESQESTSPVTDNISTDQGDGEPKKKPQEDLTGGI